LLWQSAGATGSHAIASLDLSESNSDNHSECEGEQEKREEDQCSRIGFIDGNFKIGSIDAESDMGSTCPDKNGAPKRPIRRAESRSGRAAELKRLRQESEHEYRLSMIRAMSALSDPSLCPFSTQPQSWLTRLWSAWPLPPCSQRMRIKLLQAWSWWNPSSLVCNWACVRTLLAYSTSAR
jgi:hypothetical protein